MCRRSTSSSATAGPDSAAAGAGAGAYDFFFLEPHYTLTVARPHDVLSMVVFLLVAVLTSNLTTRIRDQAEAARRREARTAALYAFAREIAAAGSIEDLLHVIVEHVARLFGTAVVLLLPDGGRLVRRAAHPAGADLTETERGTATWVWEHVQPAGRGTDTLPGGEWFHVPLGTARGAVGVLALRVESPGVLMPLDQRQGYLPPPLSGTAPLPRSRVSRAVAGR